MDVTDGPQDVRSASDDSESEEEKLSINFDLSLPGAHSVSREYICSKENKLSINFDLSLPGAHSVRREYICSEEEKLRPCSHLFRFAFRSRSGPVPLVRVAFTPAKIDRTRSGCGPLTRSHLFRNATGTSTVTHTPQQTRIFILGLLSSRRVTALTASRHRRRRSRIDGQIRRCMMCPNFGLQGNFGRCVGPNHLAD